MLFGYSPRTANHHKASAPRHPKRIEEILFRIHRVAIFSRLLSMTPQRLELVDREGERGVRGTNLATNEKVLAGELMCIDDCEEYEAWTAGVR